MTVTLTGNLASGSCPLPQAFTVDIDGTDFTPTSMRCETSSVLLWLLYRNELAAGLGRLGYGIEKTHADGRFEIAGVSREAIEAFSSRRAEIEAAMEARGLGASTDNPGIAERAALMTRAAKRDIDRDQIGGVWQRQAADLGLDAGGLVAGAVERSGGIRSSDRTRDRDRADGLSGPDGHGPEAAPDPPPSPAAEAVAWAVAHLSEREAVFARTDLFAAALAHAPGAVAMEDMERQVAVLEKEGVLHGVDLPGAEASLATEKTAGGERETVALMHAGQTRGRALMRSWQVQGHLNRGPLTAGQKDAVTLILSAKDRVVGVQGYAGTGKTTMLNRARVLAKRCCMQHLSAYVAAKDMLRSGRIEPPTLRTFNLTAT